MGQGYSNSQARAGPGVGVDGERPAALLNPFPHPEQAKASPAPTVGCRGDGSQVEPNSIVGQFRFESPIPHAEHHSDQARLSMADGVTQSLLESAEHRRFDLRRKAAIKGLGIQLKLDPLSFQNSGGGRP
jgi:hypothetical protein